ncbi:MAG: hypothetical protein JXA10_12235 [Anaerolineae bacterium]|nr:hypothetical protein [Anaerolineae bacterium]
MGYTLEVRSDAPIMWIIWEADFDLKEDIPSLAQEQLNVLDSAQEPLVVVYDTRQASQSWDDIMFLSSKAGSQENRSHPNMLARILITNDEVQAAVSQNLDNETFGNRKIYPVSSPEAALAFARKLLNL